MPDDEASTEEVEASAGGSETEVFSSARNTEVERETEEKTSAKSKRLKRYDGSGRRNTDEEIDEILDAYILYNILPQDVSERQRRDYKKHPRIPLRRMYLEQAGHIKKGSTGKSSSSRKNTSGTNVLDLAERKARRKADGS